MKPKQIKKNFGYRLIGNRVMKKTVISILLNFPEEIINFISKNCWFISSFNDGWAFVLRGTDIKKNEYIIFVSDALLKENKTQICYTITHEIGHVILGHRNSIGTIQTKSEIRKQEKEADEFAKKYS